MIEAKGSENKNGVERQGDWLTGLAEDFSRTIKYYLTPCYRVEYNDREKYKIIAAWRTKVDEGMQRFQLRGTAIVWMVNQKHFTELLDEIWH